MFLVLRKPFLCESKTNTAEEKLLYYASKTNNIIEFKNVTSLAATIGVQRETLSRLLTSLVERHLIKKEKGKITILRKKR